MRGLFFAAQIICHDVHTVEQVVERPRVNALCRLTGSADGKAQMIGLPGLHTERIQRGAQFPHEQHEVLAIVRRGLNACRGDRRVLPVQVDAVQPVRTHDVHD